MSKGDLKFKTKWTDHAEWVRFNKRRKKARRELRKIINDYGPFDYGFLLQIMEVMFKDMAEYYEKGDWIFSYYIDSECMKDVPQRDEIARELVKKLNAYYDADWDKEQEKWEEFCDYMKKYLFYLWD